MIDTNLWIRALLGGPVTIPILKAFQRGEFEVAVSDPLLEELREVTARPRLKARIDPGHTQILLDQLRWRALWVEPTTIPPRCRDIKDHPVLATAIDGQADAIVSGDADLRADDELRAAMARYQVALWGVDTFLARLQEPHD